jgi:hypothetical protein
MDLCKATYDLGGISFSSPMLGSVDINEIIEDDKKYGTMSPRNGEIFTYRVSNVHDEEITGKEMVRAVTLAWQHWSKRINIKIRKAKPHEDPDFRVIFRTVQTDERGELTDNTIMYHYFPIQDVTHSLRGLCVVNSGFYYTVHGKHVSMHEIDPEHYDDDTTSTGKTIDIDQVFTHEFGHGLGLPHDKQVQQVMSSNYGFMAEFPQERDVFRAVKKYGVPKQSPSWFSRWFNYLRHRSDNY